MAKNVTVYFADGSQHVYQNVPDAVTPDQVIARAGKEFAGRQIYHVDRSSGVAETPERPGFFGSFKEAVQTLGLTDEAAAYAADPSAENRKAFLDAAKSKYESVGGFGKGENWEAFKELLGGSLGALVAPAVTATGASLVSTPIGGLAAGAAASGAQYQVQNLLRQAQEQEQAIGEGKAPEALSLGRAFTASAGQTALDVAGYKFFKPLFQAFPFLRNLVGEAGDEAAQAATKALTDAAERGALRNTRYGTVLIEGAKGVAFEVPQEVAQQALERWQAGLSLTDENAKEEFKQAAIGAAVLGPLMGGASGLIRGRAAQEAPPSTEEETTTQPPPPPSTSEEIKSLPAPRTAGYKVDSEGNVVPVTEAEAEAAARISSENRALGLGEAQALAERMRAQRERQETERQTAEQERLAQLQERARRSLPMEQMGLPLEGGYAQMDLLAPTEPGQEIPGMYRPAEEALAGLKPRSRDYKEEAKDLGLKLDRKGNLKPNQFVPEITSQVSPDQESFTFEEQKELPLTVPASLEGQGDMFAESVSIPTREQPRTDVAGNSQVSWLPETEGVSKEVPKEQFALDLPGIPMERLTPRDRVLRAMSITEDKKNIPNLRFATQLRPMELQRALGDLKNEGAIAFNKNANEWELTPAGMENVRSGPEVRGKRRGRGTGVSVPPQKSTRPGVATTGEQRVGGVGVPPEGTDVGEKPSVPALTKEEREALIRQKFQQAAARKAVDEVTGRRTALRTQAIDAFDADEINEKTYTAITDELKKPVPNFARVTSMLEGRAKPKREKDVGLKFQRAPAVDEAGEEIAARKVKRQEAIEIAKANAESAFADQNSFRDLNDAIGAYQDNVIDTLQEYGLAEHQNYALNAYEARIKELTQKETPRKQRGEVPTTSQVTLERARIVAQNAVRNWANPPKVIVARSATDPAIPEQYRSQIPDDAKGFYIDGTTYVIADRATDEAGIRGTVFHESLGHYGLEQEFREGLNDQMVDIYRGNKAIQAAADARMAKDKSLDIATAVEEILAEKAEAGPIKDTGVRAAFNRIAAYIRNFMRKMGLTSQYTDNDVAQILRRASERVTGLKNVPYNPFDVRVRYQRSPAEQRSGDRAFINAVGKIPSSLPEATKETIQNAVDAASKVPPATRRSLYSMLNPHDMDRMYRSVTNGFGQLWNDLNAEGVYLRKQQDLITKNIKKWEAVLKKRAPTLSEKARVFKIFMDTTVDQVEVLNLKDDARNIKWEAKTDHPLYKQFSKLHPELQDVYKELRLAYLDYALGIEKALQQYLTPSEFQKLQGEFNKKRLPVYLPLFRKGDYKLKYTDRNGDTVSLQFESPAALKRARREAEREGGKEFIESEVGKRGDNEVPPSGFFGKVVAELRKKGLKDDVIAPIINAYLDLVPAQSVLQFARKRAGTAGYREDVLEAYANVGDSYARRLTSMTYTPKFRDAEDKIRIDLAAAQDRGQISADVARDLEYILDKQMDYIQNPNMSGIAAQTSYFSYQIYLGANISTALVNLLDIPTVMWSRLGGQFKFGPAFNAILKAGTTYSSRNKSPEIQELIRRGLDSGVLREQQLQEIAEFKDPNSRFQKLKAGTERVTNWAFAKSDMFNRNVALIAAYNLNKETPANVFDEKAFEAAQRAVYDVYGSSFPKAAPPIMGNDIARTALTFKRFAIVRMNLLVNAYREATKDLDPKDRDSKIIRDAARRELLGYFGTAFVFAGVQGMPLIGAFMVLATALNAVGGDDDEPYNPDFELRDAIGMFSYKGPINYLTGIDIASRTGWTGMFWREDPKRMAEVGPLTYAMEQILGPAYAYANGWLREDGAIDNFTDEKYGRALEQIMPRAIANPIKALRYAEEGARTGKGIPLTEDVNAYNIFMQIFGFSPSEVIEAGSEAGAAKRMESKILQRRNAIIERASLARLSGDYEGFQEAMEEARQFSRKHPGKAIDSDVIYGAIERRQKKLVQSVNGVSLDPKLAPEIYKDLGINPEE